MAINKEVVRKSAVYWVINSIYMDGLKTLVVTSGYESKQDFLKGKDPIDTDTAVWTEEDNMFLATKLEAENKILTTSLFLGGNKDN
jgi:hypothetical protein